MGLIDNALKGINRLNPVKLVKEAIGIEGPKPEPKPEPKIEQDAKSLSQGAAQQYNAYATVPLKETQLKNATGAAKQAAAQMAETNAQLPIAEDHEYIFQKCLDPEQQEAFRKLSSQERDAFVKLYRTIGGDWAEQNQHTEAASHAARLLLQQGTLHAVDSNGKSLIMTLGEACDKPINPALKEQGIDKYGQLQQLLKQLAYPDGIYQGEGTDTCAPSSVQNILASTMPGEFARVATELLFDGKAKVGEPGAQQEIPLSFRELNKNDDGRSLFSELSSRGLRITSG